MKKKKAKYTSDLPKRMYAYFASYQESIGAPSFGKFARSIGVTLSDLRGFRSHGEFERSWNECNEIRKDYLIDTALSKRSDSSLVKFLLSAEFGLGEDKEDESDRSLSVTLEVLEN